jgi:hypothetical protein
LSALDAAAARSRDADSRSRWAVKPRSGQAWMLWERGFLSLRSQTHVCDRARVREETFRNTSPDPSVFLRHFS